MMLGWKIGKGLPGVMCEGVSWVIRNVLAGQNPRALQFTVHIKIADTW